MVAQHYRWDFVGLSTDERPTPATSEKVVDGSTYYCSDTSKLYVWCKNSWYERKALGGGGGGTTYTAGSGIDITDSTISVDTETIQPKLTAGSNVTISDNTISATDTTYNNFIGTDGTATGTAGLVPAPATTDADKFLKSDGTWSTAGGGGGDTVYSSKTTSSSTTGGAVYIGNLDSSQEEQSDPTTTDNHYRYFWALPSSNSRVPTNNTINIFGNSYGYSDAISLGYNSEINGGYSTAIGSTASVAEGGVSVGHGSTSPIYSTSIGYNAGAYSAGGNRSYNVSIGYNAGRQPSSGLSHTVSLGAGASATRTGEVNVGTSKSNATGGYNNTAFRVIGGVHDGVDEHDAVTVGQINALIDVINTATGSNISHIGS